MFLMYPVALLIGAIVKLTEEKNFKYLAVAYFVLSLIIYVIFAGTQNLGTAIAFLIIKSGLVYVWILLLHRFDNTIFTYLLLLVLGTYLLNIF